MQHIKLKKVNLKSHPTLTERWVQDVISDDPSILGIGDVYLKDKERIHRNAGRLDLLLQDTDGPNRYEVEIQLGASDESHIIRTIEYWDIERKRYPQYDHTAVIVAEDITSRFLNVISLFNGHIPIMALQLSAIETSDGIGLHFTKILDTVTRGLVEEDEEEQEVVDRSYWEQKANPRTLGFMDTLFKMTSDFVPEDAQLSYNKYYIGIWIDGRPRNFAIFRPQKSAVRVEIKLPKTEEFDALIENAELDCLDYAPRFGTYRIRLSEADIRTKQEQVTDLMRRAHQLLCS